MEKVSRGLLEKFSDELPAEGSYGDVIAARYRGEQIVAVKSYKNAMQTVYDHEVFYMTVLNNVPHIVNPIIPFQSEDEGMYLVMDMAHNANLQELLDVAGKNLPSSTALMIARDICKGLQVMHCLGIAHKDLKPQNVLLDYGLRAKLCDFGSCTYVHNTRFLYPSGTKAYWSPEKKDFMEFMEAHAKQCAKKDFMKGVTKQYDRIKADIYSLGLILQKLNLPKDGIYNKCIDKDPAERPDCSKILQVLGERTFNYEHDQLFGITEAEIINIAYTWTDATDCCKDLAEGRKLMCTAQYSDALRKLKCCKCSEDDKMSKILIATLYMYGLGTKKDVEAARKLIEESKPLEEYLRNPGRMQDFIDFLDATMEEEKERQKMSCLVLAGKGNPLAQNALSSLWVQSAWNNKWEPNLEKDQTVDQHIESHEKHYRNNSLRLRYIAAKSGFSLSQTVLTLLFWYNNQSNYRMLRAEPNFQDDGCIFLRRAERQFLREASEGGCLMAHILLGMVDNTLDEQALKRSKRVDIYKFLARQYNIVGDTQNAVKWLEMGTSCIADAECMHEAGVLLSNKARLEDALNRGYQLSAYHLALLYQEEGRENDALEMTSRALALLYQEDVTEKDGLEMTSASPQSLHASDIVNILLELEVKSEHSKGEWYKLIKSLEKLLYLNYLLVGNHYMKKGDLQRATYWFRVAYERGQYSAAANLGGIQTKIAEASQWWMDGRANGCAICLNNLKSLCNDTNLSLVYLEEGTKLKDPRLTYEYAMHRIGTGHNEEGYQLLKEAMEYGYEDATFVMAVRNKHNTEDVQYWMGRFLRNIHSDYLVAAGALIYEEDALEFLLKSAVHQLHPEAFWRLGAYYMLTQQQEKAYYWFMKGAAKKEPKCSLVYGRLMMVSDHIPCVAMYFLLQTFSKGHMIANDSFKDIVTCLKNQQLPQRLIVIIICHRLHLISAIISTTDHGNQEPEIVDHVSIFDQQIRLLPDFGTREEMLLKYVYLMAEEREEGVRASLSVDENTSVSCMYILSMIYSDISALESKRWLCKALQSDTQVCIQSDFSLSLTPEISAVTWIERTFVKVDEDVDLATELAGIFSIEPCVLFTSLSVEPGRTGAGTSEYSVDASRSHLSEKKRMRVVASFMLKECSDIRGLIESVCLKDPSSPEYIEGISLEYRGLSKLCRCSEWVEINMRQRCTIFIPRRSFASVLDVGHAHAGILSEIKVSVINFGFDSFEVERKDLCTRCVFTITTLARCLPSICTHSRMAAHVRWLLID